MELCHKRIPKGNNDGSIGFGESWRKFKRLKRIKPTAQWRRNFTICWNLQKTFS